jgi:hypothetical protein
LSALQIPAGKRFGEARDRAGIFGHECLLRGAETGLSGVSASLAAKPRKAKDYSVGARKPELHDGGLRIIAPSLGRQDCGPIDMAAPAPAPSRWRRSDPCRQWSFRPETSNKMIRKGLAFRRERSGTGTVHYRRVSQEMQEEACAENNAHLFDYHIPVAEEPDF